MKVISMARSLASVLLIIVVSLAICAPITVDAQDWDVVIANGRVIDPESGLDAIRNLGIRSGRIESITTELLGGETIFDARGLVVAPGFIDLHVHGQDAENYCVKAKDGVTTALNLEGALGCVDAWYAEREARA